MKVFTLQIFVSMKKSFLQVKAYSHEHKITNETSSDKSAPSVYSHDNVSRPKRCWNLALILAHHQSDFVWYFVRTLYQYNT